MVSGDHEVDNRPPHSGRAVLVFALCLVALVEMGPDARFHLLSELVMCLGAGFIGYRAGRDAERRRGRMQS